MGATTHPPSPQVGRSDRLTIRYTPNPGGRVTAQIEEFPAAVSQGATDDEAKRNVLDAYHDLTHHPTVAERIAYTAQAKLPRLSESRRVRAMAEESWGAFPAPRFAARHLAPRR